MFFVVQLSCHGWSIRRMLGSCVSSVIFVLFRKPLIVWRLPYSVMGDVNLEFLMKFMG